VENPDCRVGGKSIIFVLLEAIRTTDMVDARNSKIVELRELARQFRQRAEETQLTKYVDLMRRSAAELERLADQIENGISPVEPFARAG
jgi:hypothetical protein